MLKFVFKVVKIVKSLVLSTLEVGAIVGLSVTDIITYFSRLTEVKVDKLTAAEEISTSILTEIRNY